MVKLTGSPPKDSTNDPPLHEKDLTKGSIPRNLWWLAWPQMIENILNVVDQLVDLVWAGFISASTIAGVGVAQSYKQLVMTGRMGLDTAMRDTRGRSSNRQGTSSSGKGRTMWL